MPGIPDHGHAVLCSSFFGPVMEFNQVASPKFEELLSKYRIDSDKIIAVGHDLFDQQVYDDAKQLLTSHWTAILRDQCSRTNSTLIRRNSLEWFMQYARPN